MMPKITNNMPLLFDVVRDSLDDLFHQHRKYDDDPEHEELRKEIRELRQSIDPRKDERLMQALDLLFRSGAALWEKSKE
jgi:hypothetical protein